MDDSSLRAEDVLCDNMEGLALSSDGDTSSIGATIPERMAKIEISLDIEREIDRFAYQKEPE